MHIFTLPCLISQLLLLQLGVTLSPRCFNLCALIRVLVA